MFCKKSSGRLPVLYILFISLVIVCIPFSPSDWRNSTGMLSAPVALFLVNFLTIVLISISDIVHDSVVSMSLLSELLLSLYNSSTYCRQQSIPVLTGACHLCPLLFVNSCVVSVYFPSTSDPTGSHTQFCPDCRLDTRLGHLPGLRGFDEDSCFQNNVQLLQCTASAAVYSAIRHASGPSVARRVIGALATRLRQRDPCWSTWSRVEQSVLNAAAQLIFVASKYDHVTLLLCDLHWLRVPARVYRF